MHTATIVATTIRPAQGFTIPSYRSDVVSALPDDIKFDYKFVVVLEDYRT